MAPSTFAVLLVCFTYTTYGAVLYNREGIMKSSGGVRSIRRAANLEKRSASTSTFETVTIGEQLQRIGNPIFKSTLRQYESTFLDMAPGNKTFRDVMNNIYDLAGTKWTLQRNIIDELLSEDYEEATRHIRITRSLEEFYNRTIYIYTLRVIFKELNAVLSDYTSHSDTKFGPYALVLNVVLSKWSALTACQTTTYRGVNFTTEKYTVGTIFSWTAFTSSSTDVNVECANFKGKAVFVIDNSVDSESRPKNVKRFSHFPDEKECLYVMSTSFKVTMVKLGACGNPSIPAIHLSLNLKDDPSKAEIIVTTIRGVTAVAAMTAVVVVFIIT